VLRHFRARDAGQLVRQHQPVLGLLQIVVRWRIFATRYVPVVRRRDAQIPRHVAFALAAQSIDDGAHVAPGAVDVVDDQQRVVCVQVFEQVLQAMRLHFTALLQLAQVIVATAVGGAHRDVIGIDAEILQAFLHVDADGGAAAPDTDDKIGAKSAAVNLPREAIGILEQLLLFDKAFVIQYCARQKPCAILSVQSGEAYQLPRTNAREMSEKQYLSAQQLLEDSFRLGADIIEDGFRPSIMIAIWRGGVPMGIAIQELLTWYGIETDHIAIRTSSYSGIDGQSTQIRIHGMNYLIKNCTREDRLLIVDDVFDTGLTIDAVIDHLQAKARLNTPADIRVAVPYYKPSRRKTSRIPDYYLHETARWLKYPHSLEGLSIEEVAANRPELYAIIEDLLQ